MLNKLRLFLALGIGVPILLLVGVVAVHQYLRGKGKVVLVASEPLTFSIDQGAPQTLAAGQHQELELEQGAHHFQLESELGKGNRTVNIDNGMVRFLVPADDGQCFVLLDVSRSHFQYGSKPADQHPKIRERIKSSDLFDLPGSSVYFTEAELPRSLEENHACNLLVECDCADLARGDDELLTSLGY